MSNTRGKLPNSPEILYLTVLAWCFGILAVLGAINVVRILLRMTIG